MKKISIILCLLLITLALHGPSWGKTYPDKPVNVIQAFSVGGSSDILLRGISPYVIKELNTQIVIQNVPGAGGVIGYNKAFKAPPDGYNLLFSNFPTLYTVELISKNSLFRTKEFIPVYAFAKDYVMVVIHPDIFQNFEDFAKTARTRPLRVGATGRGTPTNLGGLILEKALGVKFNFIPYESGAESVTALAGNHIDAVVTYSSSATALIRAKKVKPLLLFSEERPPTHPQVPVLKEFGYDAPSIYSIYGIFAPPHVPPERLKTLGAAFERAATNPAFVDWMKKGTAEYIHLNEKAFKSEFGKLITVADGFRDLIK